MSSDRSDPPSSLAGRGLELLLLGARLGTSEIRKRVSQASDMKAQMDQAKTLVASLGHLKGAAMKVGQLLSIEGRDLLPPEIVAVLSQLQDAAPPVNFGTLLKVLREDLGDEKLGMLSHIEETALASASMGQVHRAKLNGQPIVLKIQYPDINTSIRSDLKILRSLFSSFLALGGRQIDLEPMFAELADILESEADYRIEAENLIKYRDVLSRDDRFVVPKVFLDFSTQRVLCMSEEPGMKFDQFLKTNPSLAKREAFGRMALDLYTIEFFEAGFVQTDPNFANFLLRPESEQLVCLDLGAAKSFSVEFRSQYKKLLRAIRAGTDQDVLDQACHSMNLLSADESAACKSAFVAMLRASVEPFDPRRQPFSFFDRDYAQQVRTKSIEFTKLVRKSAPPHQILFLHRKLGGVFSLLRTMNVAIDLTPYWNRLVSGS